MFESESGVCAEDGEWWRIFRRWKLKWRCFLVWGFALRGGVNRVRARRLRHGQHSTPACLWRGVVVFDPDVGIRD
eukprot:2571532-Pleurochrysis_carterae.AAC.1